LNFILKLLFLGLFSGPKNWVVNFIVLNRFGVFYCKTTALKACACVGPGWDVPAIQATMRSCRLEVGSKQRRSLSLWELNRFQLPSLLFISRQIGHNLVAAGLNVMRIWNCFDKRIAWVCFVCKQLSQQICLPKRKMHPCDLWQKQGHDIITVPLFLRVLNMVHAFKIDNPYRVSVFSLKIHHQFSMVFAWLWGYEFAVIPMISIHLQQTRLKKNGLFCLSTWRPSQPASSTCLRCPSLCDKQTQTRSLGWIHSHLEWAYVCCTAPWVWIFKEIATSYLYTACPCPTPPQPLRAA